MSKLFSARCFRLLSIRHLPHSGTMPLNQLCLHRMMWNGFMNLPFWLWDERHDSLTRYLLSLAQSPG